MNSLIEINEIREREDKLSANLNRRVLSGVQKLHHQDYDEQSLQWILHDPRLCQTPLAIKVTPQQKERKKKID